MPICFVRHDPKRIDTVRIQLPHCSAPSIRRFVLCVATGLGRIANLVQIQLVSVTKVQGILCKVGTNADLNAAVLRLKRRSKNNQR